MARSSEWFEYSPSSQVLRRRSPSTQAVAQIRTGGFRRVELNAAGWAAVVGPSALTGLVAGVVFDRSLLMTVPVGAVCSWLVAVGVDRWRWSRSECGFEVSNLADEAMRDVTAELNRRGVSFRLEAEAFQPDEPSRFIYCQMRHRRHVDAAIDAARSR